jgi:hypothetical protein
MILNLGKIIGMSVEIYLLFYYYMITLSATKYLTVTVQEKNCEETARQGYAKRRINIKWDERAIRLV